MSTPGIGSRMMHGIPEGDSVSEIHMSDNVATARAVLDALTACAEDSTVDPRPLVDGFDLETVFINGEFNMIEVARLITLPRPASHRCTTAADIRADWLETLALIEYEHVRRNNQATVYRWDVDGYGMNEDVRNEYRRAVVHQVDGLTERGLLPPTPVEVSQ